MADTIQESASGQDPHERKQESKENGSKKKDWLAVGGIEIEKRRRSSSNYRLENNKVVMENASGETVEFEIVDAKEMHGTLRKAVPVMPIPIAVLCLLLNIVPGLGTLISGFCALCGCKTEHDSRLAGFCYNVLVALLQLVLSPFIVGWIWSIQRGVIMMQESLKQKIDEREKKQDPEAQANMETK